MSDDLTAASLRVRRALVEAFASYVRARLGERDIEPSEAEHANLRVLVPDVDHHWEAAQERGLRIVTPIGDHDYGLRDFTVADPDGFGVRFGTWLHDL